MFRKSYFTFLLAAAVFFVGTTAAFAQSGMARGMVMLKKADGTSVPLADVVIDLYRMDMQGRIPQAKTNKKGEFAILGFLPGVKYAMAVSAPGVTADVFPDIKGGDEKLTINVVEGDGKVLTEQEVRQILTNAPKNAAPKGELTADQKKRQEDIAKQQAKYEEEKKKVDNINEVVNRALKEGDAQFNSKNYDAAVARYDEGINADPDFAGSASILLNKKALALRVRALDKSNETVKADPAVRTQAMVGVKKDFEDALAALDKSLALIKGSTETDAKIQKNLADIKVNDLEQRKEVFRLMSRTGADRTKGKEAAAAFQEYIDAATDPKEKAEARVELLNVLMDAQESDLAVAEAEKVLAQEPNNADALAVAGLSLINVGYMKNDKAKLQQGANYLQKYTEVAPANHQYVADAKSLIESLKKEQNVAPQKNTKKKN